MKLGTLPGSRKGLAEVTHRKSIAAQPKPFPRGTTANQGCGFLACLADIEAGLTFLRLPSSTKGDLVPKLREVVQERLGAVDPAHHVGQLFGLEEQFDIAIEPCVPTAASGCARGFADDAFFLA